METNLKSIVPLDTASGVDLSAKLGCAVGVDSSGNATLGGNFGVVVVEGASRVSVAVFGGNAGPVLVKLAGSVDAGDMLVRDGSAGTFTKAAATDVAEARAIEAGAATELIPAVLLPPAAAVGATVFAAAGHDHDEAYAAIDHDHDAAYAAIDHTHT